MLTGGDGLGEGGVGVFQQVAEQPQFQRMDLGDVALVRQVVGARAVGLIELGQALVAEFFRFLALEVSAHEPVETLLAGLGSR